MFASTPWLIIEKAELTLSDGATLVTLEMVCNSFVQRVFEIWRTHETLDGDQNSSDLECWTPFVFQDVKTDPA
jgi:hypothetical protein